MRAIALTLAALCLASGCTPARPPAPVPPHTDHFVSRAEFTARWGQPRNSVGGLEPAGGRSLGFVYTVGMAYTGSAVGDLAGLYHAADDTCWVVCSGDPDAAALLTMIHEHAHRWDALHRDRGGSPLWRLLAGTSAGRAHLTHNDINTRLRAEGYLP